MCTGSCPWLSTAGQHPIPNMNRPQFRPPQAIGHLRRTRKRTLWDVGLGLVPAGQLDGVGNCPERFFDKRLRAGVDPEYPCVRLPHGDSMSELDGKLRQAAGFRQLKFNRTDFMVKTY